MTPALSKAWLRRVLFEWVAVNEQIEDVYFVCRWMRRYGQDQGLPNLGDRGRIGLVELDPQLVEKIERDLTDVSTWMKGHRKNVFIFSSVPDYAYEPCDLHARSEIFPFDQPISVLATDFNNRQAPISEIFDRIRDRGFATIVPLGEVFVDDGETVFAAADGTAYYRDSNHLSAAGAAHAIRQLADLLWRDG